MKPARIQVFDGLRITTEHFDHMQAGWKSVAEDLREVIGLGLVYRGCEVSIADTTVTVQPGLAFDQQKSRLVLDEPKTATLELQSGENTRYVCLKYDQVETEKVGDQFTLIFDSCAVELTPTSPAPNSGLVAIARVDRTSSGFSVTPLNRALLRTAPPTDEVRRAAPWRVQQGVVGLSPDPSSRHDLAGLLVASLRESIAAQPNAAPELRVNMSQHAIPLDFAVRCITSHVALSAQVSVENPASQRSYTSTSHGEAIFGPNGVSQFGLATEMTQQGVASVAIGSPTVEDPTQPLSVHTALRAAQVVLAVKPASPSGFTIEANLMWIGGVTEQEVAVLESTKPTLVWSASVGWNARGDSPDPGAKGENPW